MPGPGFVTTGMSTPVMIGRTRPVSSFMICNVIRISSMNFANDPEYAPVLNTLREENESFIQGYSREEAASPKPLAAGAPFVEKKRFDGKTFEVLPRTPALGPDDDYTWSFRVKVLPGNPPGAVLLGNRIGGAQTEFMKITAKRGVQLFTGGTRRFTHQNTPVSRQPMGDGGSREERLRV